MALIVLNNKICLKDVNDVNDPRFQQTFEKVFESNELLNTPWFVLLGNHDHRGNASAQIEYTHTSKRWIMPSYNYTIDIKLNDNNDTFIRIIMIDTVTLCGNDIDENEIPKFNTKDEELQSAKYFQAFKEELRKLNDEYVPYVIVSGHFPVWSVGKVGSIPCLVNKLRPLLHKHNVSAYFAGHDHDLQHISDNYLNQTVDYFVNGASNVCESTTVHLNTTPPDSLKYFWGYGDYLLNGGLALIKANRKNLTHTFIETGGKELYEKVIYPRWNINGKY